MTELDDIMEDLMVGHNFEYARKAISDLIAEAYKNGYVDAIEKKHPKHLLGFDPLNLPVEDKE